MRTDAIIGDNDVVFVSSAVISVRNTATASEGPTPSG